MNLKLAAKNYEFQWGERHSMLSAQIFAQGFGSYGLGKPKKIDYLVLSENRYLHTYASWAMVSEWKQFSNKALTTKGRQSLIQSCQKITKTYHGFFQKFSRLNIPKLSNPELFQILNQYFKIIVAIGSQYGISQANGTDAVYKKLRQKLKQKNALNNFETLITPAVPDLIAEEQADLSKLNKNSPDVKLTNHALKYAWLFFNSYSLEDNLKYLRNRLGEKFNIQEELRKKRLPLKNQTKLFTKLKDPEIKSLSVYLQRLSIERLRLKDCWGGGEFRFLSLFKEISQRLKIPFQNILFSYTLKDYELALLKNHKLGSKVMNERKRQYVWWKKEQKLNFFEGSPAKKIIKQFQSGAPEKTNSKILKGVSASSGKVIGTVRIVKSLDIRSVLKDAKSFKKGNILVTWMTQPNMLIIAKKAGGIVADEGGITSHAAIIARELNIPCVVGTQSATSSLKDGDKIMVDGTNGQVIKL